MPQNARITEKSNEIAEELHAITGESKIAIIEAALIEYRYRQRMRLYNEAYEKLRNNEASWNEEMEERSELEGTSADGFDEL